MLDHRGRLLLVTVGDALLPLPDEPAVRALHGWLDTWRGIRDLEAGMARQGYDLQLTRYAGEAWRATFTSPAASTHRTGPPAARGNGRRGEPSRSRRGRRFSGRDLLALTPLGPYA